MSSKKENPHFQGPVATLVEFLFDAETVIIKNYMTPHVSKLNESPYPKGTLIFSYRATDAYPIWVLFLKVFPRK